ncbi:uncharacterized protein BDW43DRAFT_277678 [Aspergillus alliaceus]|uniref:uncharacterized protein n=1 Tax=Petromyces alliaceus TaxID=209559 RepID=UPI0012A4E5B8|nr:uncharacterized protein BDW43DRAFT_277678 [Aspergillus alliaceus]KAB8232847.1 hypothetical protein BDW43DRAFT_277678 [Aspergillus alliaceus]
MEEVNRSSVFYPFSALFCFISVLFSFSLTHSLSLFSSFNQRSEEIGKNNIEDY